jgi:hypothetical protein
MSERIFLTYTNATAVPYQGSELGHHIVLNYIDGNGDHYTLQGVPEHRFEHNIDKLGAFVREELFSDGANIRDSPFGRLQVRPEHIDSDASLNQPHTMIAEGEDLSSRWALMQDLADEVNSIGYEYRPISQNSNSFAGGALQRAGFFGPGTAVPERFNGHRVVDPISGETKSFYVPGFEAPLTNPINTATPMPFALDVPAARPAPTNRFVAPDRHGFLDSGFGNRGSSPASSPVQGTPPPTPAFQPDAVYSPAGDFFGNFPRTSAGAATTSPAAFNTSGSSFAPMRADFNALARDVTQLRSAGPFTGNNQVAPGSTATLCHHGPFNVGAERRSAFTAGWRC